MPQLLFGLALLSFLFVSLSTFGAQRFPPPDFEEGHVLPTTTTPAPRALAMEYVDVALMIGALGVAAWLTLRKRSRQGLVALSLFSVAYFGFYREGCLCAIGSIQNVSLALFDHTYAMPVFAMAFFAVPLVFALFFGRAFCAGVCPHGALQDLVLVKPVKLPNWLEHGLSLLPFVYLGAGVMFAATGSAFIICRYDPFVPLFRLSGSFSLLVLGGVFLVVGMFIGRPYCRFLCPYGALLKLASTVSKWRVRTTPDYCTQCKLCEQSCPFGAMREPSSGTANPVALRTERKRLTALLVLTPVLMLALGWVGSLLGPAASKLHPDVRLAEFYLQQQQAPVEYAPQSPEALELDRARKHPQELLTGAAQVRRQFGLAGWLLGAWIGLVLGAKLISLSIRRMRTDYEPDRGACVGCARCFEFCPNERVRLGLLLPEAVDDYVAANRPPGQAAVATVQPASNPPSATA